MGRKKLGVKSRSAQKGKKAWRRINTDDLNESLAEKSRDERQGLDFERVPDADLFYVDKGLDDKAPAAVAPAAVAPAAATAAAAKPVTKKEAARARTLRSEAILEAAHKARPVAAANPRAKKESKNGASVAVHVLPDKSKGLAVVASKTKTKTKRTKEPSGLYDLWATAPGPAARRREPVIEVQTPAVVVDGPGCSFNPDPTLHSEAVAEAVAAEMKKINAKDVMPVAPATTVDYDVDDDELAMLQVDEPESEDESEPEPEEGGEWASKSLKPQIKKTQTERNRLARRKLTEAALAEARAEKLQRRSIAHVTEIIKDVEEEEAANATRRQRIEADKAESLTGLPPRLSKLRFEPMQSQVLPSSEISGSLRKLKPTSFLAKERFKSLQQRGMIEVRKPTQRKGAKRVTYIRGEKGEREREGHAEIMAARKARKGT